MHIIHLISELAPIAKVGGLGDVTASLSKALAANGKRVEVILPFYNQIIRDQLEALKIAHENFSACGELNNIWSAQVNGISALLIEPQNNYFRRGTIYGERDDPLRFIYFTLTAMEYLLREHTHPDILHLHDWPTALAAPLYHEKYRSLGLRIGGVVTTIHNIKYQGVCKEELFAKVGLNPSHFSTQDRLGDLNTPNRLNLLKGALIYSDLLTTVSPSYAQEIIEGEEGFGLGHLIDKRGKNFRGILNGIDTSYWNPENDPFLKTPYPPRCTSLDTLRKAKGENRQALKRLLRMDSTPKPLFTSITRLVRQKGPEMIHLGLKHILKKGGQFVLLASNPEKEFDKLFRFLDRKYHNNSNIHFHFAFDEELAHLIFAAADAILIPSLFEPCGLTQMIALRYGTIPIVHKVGGLKDTIFDIDHSPIAANQRNGYTFNAASGKELRRSIDRALNHLRDDPQKWECMLKSGFSRDWGWDIPASHYLKAYNHVLRN